MLRSQILALGICNTKGIWTALADVPQLNSNGDSIGEMLIDPGEGGTSSSLVSDG